MAALPVLIFGDGHLAYRIRALAAARGHAITSLTYDTIHAGDPHESTGAGIARALRGVDLRALGAAYLVDDRDERNLEMLISLIALDTSLPIAASLFNESIAPHLQAAHPNVRVVNPAKLAASGFIDALRAPLHRTLRYVPAPIAPDEAPAGGDRMIRGLATGFVATIVAAVAYFHAAEDLSWINALYFVVVTVATVGYGDISLLNYGVVTKLVGIALIVTSTFFIWMIFSLTIDRILKRRVQLALGRKTYSQRDHVILCGLGRLGYFIAEGLLAQGEHVVIVEKDESRTSIDHLRSLGAEVYIGDARLPRVLRDVGVTRARALYSVLNNDYVNLEIGLNARSFEPRLRLILRIFDESMSRNVRDHLDVHLTLSMSALADDALFNAPSQRPPG